MKYIYDPVLKKLVEYKREVFKGLTIIPDEPEFVSKNAFPETVKWTGRRSKKAIMKKFNCVDYRDTEGVGKEKLKRIQQRRESYKQDPMVQTSSRSIPDSVEERRTERRKKYFTGYRIVR